MKPFFLSLSLLLLASPAQADVLSLAAKVSKLQKEASENLDYMVKNLHKCSKYHEDINGKKLIPNQEKLETMRLQYAAAFSSILSKLNSPTCKLPTANEWNSFSSMSSKLENKVGSLLEELLDNDSKLMEAFEADSRYPQCVPTKPGDKNSTKESLAYQRLKVVLKNYKESLRQLAAEAKGPVLAGGQCGNEKAAYIEGGSFVHKAVYIPSEQGPATFMEAGLAREVR